jgi:hypothetical protein
MGAGVRELTRFLGWGFYSRQQTLGFWGDFFFGLL